MRYRGEYPHHQIDFHPSQAGMADAIPEPMQDALFEEYDSIKEFQGQEAEKTEFHLRTIDQFNSIWAHIAGVIGVSAMTLSAARVHIIKNEVFRLYTTNQVSDMEPQGFVRAGHVYIPDNQDETEFIFNYSHEFSHVISRSKELVVAQVQKISDEVVDLTLAAHFVRVGVDQVSVRKEKTKNDTDEFDMEMRGYRYGTGFNEAMTEMIAQQLRQVYVDALSNKVSKRKKNKLLEYDAYETQIMVVDALLAKYFGTSDVEVQQVFHDMIRLMTIGDPKLLRELHVKMRADGYPDGLKKLFAMGLTIESVLECADALDLEDVIKEIRQIILEDDDNNETYV